MYQEPLSAFMYASNHPNLTVKDCGFFIHPQKGWIGTSPDGVVVDPTYNPPNGILEVKCPYSMQDIPPNKYCQDTTFYCFIDKNGKFQLKRDHAYYHQVTVCSNLYSWCDFCIYTTKGILVERISTDYDLINKCIRVLKNIFNTHSP